jgi:hypothetical protein
MKRSLVRWFVRATLQMIVLSYSQGILANDFMEYSDLSSEQVTYETKVHNDKHEAYRDPQFHNDSYLNAEQSHYSKIIELEQFMSEDNVASSDF